MNNTFHRHRCVIFFFGMCLMLFLCCKTSQLTTVQDEFVIAFGSCNHQWEAQPIWKEVVKLQPDLWIWLGDIIYADTEDMSKMRKDYEAQRMNVDYNYLDAATEVIGIWDDHDYGSNNAGKEYPKKDSSKLLLFDFLNVPEDDPSRKRPGAYQSYDYQSGGLSLKVILLDVRYFRDKLDEEEGTILGRDQWRWLTTELSGSTADAHVIAGGIQFLPEDHKYEKWANFPKERKRLISLLDSLAVHNPILLSGDRHLAEMSLVQLPASKQPLIEVTSSGLTHAYTGFSDEENRHRIGSVTATENFGILTINKSQGEPTYECEIRNGIGQVQSSANSEELPILLQELRQAQDIQN